MGIIRLNKVTKECNVGLQTAVEFLQKKGFSDVEANPNAKISQEQYDLLVAEFKNDQGLRRDAEQLSIKRQNNKENNKNFVEIKVDAHVMGETAKAVTDAGERPVEVKSAKETVAPVVEEPVHEAPREAEKVKAAVSADAVQEVVAPKSQEMHFDEPEPVEEAKPQPQEELGVETDGVFRLAISSKDTPQLKVKGHIDLSALNQSTRPKKKTKEEKRKEREEKNRQQQDARNKQNNNAGGQNNGEKKKRVRVGKERVDVNAVSAKNNNNNNGNANHHGNNNQNGNNNNAGGKHGKKKNVPPQPVKQEVSDEDVAKQVKETLARLTNKNKTNKGAKYRKEKRENARANMEEHLEELEAESRILKLTEFVTANELASMMNVPVTQVIGTCMSIGIMVSINQRLDAETINLVAEEFGFKTEYVSAEVSEAVNEEEDDEEDLVPRAPIVTVMGHVDHGKTSLLDYIRKTNVIAGEAGGITQHIGAYNVTLEDGRHITFLDTPGHEAFTAMRARGAQVTDIAIIIIAADDDIMPQTKEAINHAVAANVPIVFAINKIDKPAANPDKIKESLAAMNFLVEDWGGKYQSQDISAKKGIGVDELLEKVLLEAEMLDLKANPNRRATGSVIESSLDKGRGYVATVLVSNGTLRMGDIVLAGTHYGRIKAMFNERNQRVKEIGPAQAATILGLNGAGRFPGIEGNCQGRRRRFYRSFERFFD